MASNVLIMAQRYCFLSNKKTDNDQYINGWKSGILQGNFKGIRLGSG
jgi:hypothetical protein